MTAVLLAEAPPRTDDELTHVVYHCHPNLALCGTDVTAMVVRQTAHDCVVCVDLDGGPCRRCLT